MKKFARIALTACLLLGIAAQANAVDFKIKGRWISLFDYGQNGNMTGGDGSTGYAKGFDNFEALQRWRIQLDAVASENLSGTVHFEIGKHRWGQASTGGQLGSDSNMVRLKHAYIDWRVPETDLKLRMGIQAINLPGFATDSQVMGSDVAGITASYTFNDNVGLTAFWARAYNDNFLGSDDDAPNNKQNFMDNVDFFGLVLPLTFEGARITPWVMGGMIGPNAFRTQDGYLTNIANCYFVPNLTALNYGFHGNKLTGYGTAFWAGLTGEVTAFDPFRLAWDFNYGSVTYDDGAASRRGWPRYCWNTSWTGASPASSAGTHPAMTTTWGTARNAFPTRPLTKWAIPLPPTPFTAAVPAATETALSAAPWRAPGASACASAT